MIDIENNLDKVEISNGTFSSSLPRLSEINSNDLGIFFSGDNILVSKNTSSYVLPIDQVFMDLNKITSKNSILVGEWDKKNLFAVSLGSSSFENNCDFSLVNGREILTIIDAENCKKLMRAKHLLFWHRSTLFCGYCGNSTNFSKTETAKYCIACKKLFYPSVFPAVIVLIVREKHVLLARSPYFPPGIYSTIAGFVDGGESLEDAIHREVHEELGIKIKDITYFNSQSWPFPNSLMIGFRVKYDSGELQIDKKEIEDANWYSVSDLPLLPPKCSIARHLIDSYSNSVS